MIALNERSRFGSCALRQTDGFSCSVSTAPGLFKDSVLIMPIRPNGTVRRIPLAKAYLKRGLSRADRDAVHDYLVGLLEQLGNDKFNLANAVEGALSTAKARGLILDYTVGKPKQDTDRN